MIVEVDATETSDAPNGEALWGVFCRLSDDGDYYSMEVYNDGYAAIGRQTSDGYTELAGEFSASSAFNEDSENRIRGDCVGDTLTMYVNGENVLQTTDSEYESGAVGVAIANIGDDPPELDVSFDDFSVSTP